MGQKITKMFLVMKKYDTFALILWEEMICKISPLLKFKISGVFPNTLTVDDGYTVWDCENSQFNIQMQLS